MTVGDVGELQQIAERWISDARPGEELEVAVSRGVSTSVKAYQGSVESFTSATTYGIGIRVIVDGRQGFAHAGTFDAEIIAATLADARDNVSFAEPDPHNGLAQPDGVAAVVQDLWRDEVLRLPAEKKVALALELEAAVRAADSRIKGVQSASYGDSAWEFALASTAGIRSPARGTSCWVSVSALAGDESETQTGGGVDVARDPSQLDLSVAVKDAVEQATRLLGAKKAMSQRLPILLEADLAATLLGIVAGTLSGDVVVRGRSLFAERVGEQIASPLLTLVDDPTDSRSFGADSYDGEGLACRPNVLIEAGVLQGFLHNSYSARRAGSRSTGSAVRSSRGASRRRLPGARRLSRFRPVGGTRRGGRRRVAGAIDERLALRREHGERRLLRRH